LRYLLDRQFALLLYFNYPPQFGPKPQYCASEHLCLLLPRVPLLRIFSMISEFPRFRLSAVVVGAIDRGPHDSFLFPQKHESRVDRDPCKPRRKARSAFEGMKVNKGPYHGFLEHIFCILPIVCHSIDPMQYAPGMALAKFNKRRRVPGSRHRNQHRIFRRIRFLPVGGSIEF